MKGLLHFSLNKVIQDNANYWTKLYLFPSFQIKQSQMLRSVQTSLFLIIPILEKLLKYCLIISVLSRVIKNFTVCFRQSQGSKASQNVCRGWSTLTIDCCLLIQCRSNTGWKSNPKIWEGLGKRWTSETRHFFFSNIRWVNESYHLPLKIKAQKCTEVVKYEMKAHRKT